jgi:hypothetical protein
MYTGKTQVIPLTCNAASSLRINLSSTRKVGLRRKIQVSRQDCVQSTQKQASLQLIEEMRLQEIFLGEFWTRKHYFLNSVGG